MYEFQNVNQNIVSELVANITKLLIKEKYVYIVKAIEYAIKKELPNEPKYIIDPLIIKVKKSLEILPKRKVIPFESELEAQLLFKKIFKYELDSADKNVYGDNWTKLIYDSYDLCKFDKKLIYQEKEYLYNVNFLILEHRKHYKAYNRWVRENKLKPDEFNINISHNTNKGLTNQLDFLRNSYNLYNHNPYAQNFEKDLEQYLINCYEEDRYMMARSIQEIASIKFKVDTFKDKEYIATINSFKNLKPYLNSDKVIDKKEIIHSWLTSVAILYLKLNPSGIKATTLGQYITTIAKATTIYENFKGEYIIPIEKIRKANFREIAVYNNLRIIEFTDNRKKLTYNEKSINGIENYLKNINSYIKKLKF
ncbi:hypothetical protein [Aliarcobacter cibarius]|uniref:Uncharacterized protein n=1 Tax=Aliarcobacter cibarius TaxID=255507 RepID=A0ABY2V6I7_9BACT|nr:hypothetical protein [Aliarcobacter cibarius]TLS99569.1 hypothetical protein FE247_05645 [Aliarcobacter cibarius]TLT00006.1 hypothetical protein FE245_05920 [Aliarcobacter cibarius]